MSRYKPINIPSRHSDYGDQVRIATRHYGQMCELADKGGYSSLGQLLAAMLDVTLPRVKLIERPLCDVVITDEPDPEE